MPRPNNDPVLLAWATLRDRVAELGQAIEACPVQGASDGKRSSVLVLLCDVHVDRVRLRKAIEDEFRVKLEVPDAPPR